MPLFLIALFFGIGALVPTSVTALGFQCGKRPNFVSSNQTITCPGPYDPPSYIRCCDEFTSRVRCCPEPTSPRPKRDVDDFNDDDIPLLSDSESEKRSIVRGLAKLVGIILGAAAFVIILCIVCCCCCPFCFFYQRRQGEVIRTNTGPSEIHPQQGQQPLPGQQAGGYYQVPQAGPQPYTSQQGYLPQQPVYPPQQTGYPPQQPGYLSQQPPYPPQPVYTDGAPPPYPGPPTDTNPAAPQKLAAEYQTQPAYNPSVP